MVSLNPRIGAIAALTAAKPGRRRSNVEISELAKLRAEVDRLGSTVIEQAIELAVLRGNELGLNGPIPARAAKAAMTRDRLEPRVGRGAG